ncbi:MAG: SDR family oxidoreductase [Sporichthyaceae bacterium]
MIGASGYVGSRLVEALPSDATVRALTRDPARLADAGISGRVETAQGDVVSGDGLDAAMRDVDVVYYLAHSLAERDFARLDGVAAQNVATAAAAAGVGRIVYLGGLRPPAGETASEHLASREQVGQILLAGSVPTVVLRAGMVVGSGSASFEILRHLTERMPVTLTPPWLRNRTQPIAVADVLHYLTACAHLPATVHRAFDIGGPDVLTYAELTRRYARVARLPRRFAIPVPFLSVRASALGIAAATPVSRRLAKPLLESLRHDLVCAEHDISDHVPPPPDGPMDFESALRAALHGPDAAPAAYSQRWEIASDAKPDALWRTVEGLGGNRGWHTIPGVFEVRGAVDHLLGGVGAHRGRRDPDRLRTGDTVDFWRVEAIEHGHRLVLRAEMKMPGTAWLIFTVLESDNGGSVLRQEVRFAPAGVGGPAYWWLQRPVHDAVFGVMARGVARAAATADDDADRS